MHRTTIQHSHHVLPRRLSDHPTITGDKGPRPEAFVWSRADNIFVGFNTLKVDVPPRVCGYGRRSFDEMMKMEWEQRGFAYLAYLPLEENFRGPLWWRLGITRKRFPVLRMFQNGRHWCHLDDKLVNSWVRLEENLLRIIDILKAATNFRAIKFPPLPKSIKLKNAHEYESEEALVKAAFATRDRFIFLGAVLAFYISMQRDWATYLRSARVPGF